MAEPGSVSRGRVTAPEHGDIDHLRALMQQTPAALVGNAIGTALVCAMFWPHADRRVLLGWAAAGVALWALRIGHYRRYRSQPDAPPERMRAWRRSWRPLVLAQGALWGLAAWLFWDLGSIHHGLGLIFVVMSYCLASVPLLSSQPRVFLVFVTLTLLPLVARIATDQAHPWHWQLSGLLAVMFGMTLLMGRTYSSALGQSIALRARTAELAVGLEIERAKADDARRAAEAASRAKTQFFAAASHDLRQPLHAMGLFAEALRQRVRDPDVAGLVHSINESVDALEGLFAELLDITRIDSGGVEVQARPTRLAEVFARLRLHFEPVAFEKGLALSFRGGERVVHADPVLLERVLRNLLANAIRYTNDGGVLIGARARGREVLLQVWDSGIGIAPELQLRVFDEFYQVDGARAPDAHQRKGLGLGLAIVQRLARLMGTQVGVRSRVGRGSVFELALPAGTLAAHAPELGAPGAALRALTLAGRRLVVVEDEPAVREGLLVLLTGWGAQVEAFDGLPALHGWLAAAQTPRPDLALVDHRLPDGATSLDVLAALRARWPALPAVVVTGSSMGGLEQAADAHDFHLLLKPVLPAKLRAMIAFKLGMR